LIQRKRKAPKICHGLGRDYPIVQQVVEAGTGNGVTYNSGHFELDDGVDDKIKMVRADDN